jgi:cytochrome c-type biogenesis protein CcmH
MKFLKIKLQKILRCLICQGQSVYDSDSEFANSIKIVVDNKIR